MMDESTKKEFKEMFEAAYQASDRTSNNWSKSVNDRLKEIGDDIAGLREHVKEQNSKVFKNEARSIKNQLWIKGSIGAMSLIPIIVGLVGWIFLNEIGHIKDDFESVNNRLEQITEVVLSSK